MADIAAAEVLEYLTDTVQKANDGVALATREGGRVDAYRRDGKLVLEIDEHRFRADAFLQSQPRILDRDAFLASAFDTVY